ncbi:hypothetical protein [Amycolatopsis albispora]|uniref:DUF5667 domain-containing protein n=1 Tax=Amycolatopsis albispora TaxID=1804986 RepID=A0A344LIH7_9PSEU|nr:hypothetical protein [Amycolatopsis albispora]AXB47851.1 hypothetical protein A4R43_39870 [Amycolatopsis albispora]
MRNALRLGAAALILCSLAACGAPDEPAAPPAAPPPAPSPPAPPPTPAQVDWLNRFCQAAKVFLLPPEPPRDLRDEFTAMDLSSYLSTVSTSLSSIRHQSTTLAPETFPHGKELVDAYTTAAEQLGNKVDEYSRQYTAAEDVLRGYVTETTEALKTLRPQGLDLPTLVATDGTVAQAHQQAEKCQPPKEEGKPSTAPVELPAAKDGERLSACSDGRCEVLVSAGAEVPAPKRFGFELIRVRAIADGVLQLGAKVSGGSMTSPLDTGRATIMNGLEVKAVAVGDGKAVLSLAPA